MNCQLPIARCCGMKHNLLLPSLPHHHKDIVFTLSVLLPMCLFHSHCYYYAIQLSLSASASAGTLFSLLPRNMDIDSSGTSTWLYDYGFDISVAGSDFLSPNSGGFSWVPQTVKSSSNLRLRSQSCASGSKACCEKLRRDKLSERFLELSSIWEPSRLPKTDKVAILSNAVRVVTQLRNEAQKLKEMNVELLVKVKELKADKIELRDEKNKLKIDKEKLEQQVKAMNALPGFLPHPPIAKAQAASHKLIPFIGYPGIAMWRFMPLAAVDTSEDHLLRPPVAQLLASSALLYLCFTYIFFNYAFNHVLVCFLKSHD